MVGHKRFGGEFMINVKNHLQFSIRNDLNNPDFQIMWKKSTLLTANFLLGSYRPHNSRTDKLNNLAISLDNAIDTALPIFLMGDFNIDTLSCCNNVFKHHDISWEN